MKILASNGLTVDSAPREITQTPTRQGICQRNGGLATKPNPVIRHPYTSKCYRRVYVAV